MNPIFKYNSNTNYSTKDLKDGNNDNDFSLLDLYLNKKGPSAKIQLLDMFKGHQIAAKLRGKKQWQIAVTYDELPLPKAVWPFLQWSR